METALHQPDGDSSQPEHLPMCQPGGYHYRQDTFVLIHKLLALSDSLSKSQVGFLFYICTQHGCRVLLGAHFIISYSVFHLRIFAICIVHLSIQPAQNNPTQGLQKYGLSGEWGFEDFFEFAVAGFVVG